MLCAYPSLHSGMLKQQAAPFQTAFKLQTAGLTEVGAGRNTSHKPRHPAISPGCSIPVGPMHEQGPRQLATRNLQEEPFLPPAIKAIVKKIEGMTQSRPTNVKWSSQLRQRMDTKCHARLQQTGDCEHLAELMAEELCHYHKHEQAAGMDS